MGHLALLSMRESQIWSQICQVYKLVHNSYLSMKAFPHLQMFFSCNAPKYMGIVRSKYMVVWELSLYNEELQLILSPW